MQVSNERDDTPYIQGLIDTAIQNGESEITIPSINPADNSNIYKIGTSIVLPSNITVYIDNCTLRLNDGVLCNIFASQGLYNSDTLTIDDEIKNVKIIGIGNAVLDGGNHNGITESTATKTDGYSTTRKNISVFFRNVNGFKISNLTIKEPRYWGITFEFCRNGEISDIVFDCSNNSPNQDGIDLRCGNNNIRIDNISGVTGDDTVALTALSSNRPTFFAVEGKDYDIHDVSITNLNAYCSGGHGIIRLLAHHGNQIYNIDVKNIVDTSSNIHAFGVLRIGDTNYVGTGTAMEYGDINNVTIDNVTSNSEYAIYIGYTSKVTSQHVKYSNITTNYGQVTNMTVEDFADIEYLPGESVYQFKRADKSDAIGDWTDNTSREIVSNTGTFLGMNTAATVWPLQIDAIQNNAALQVISPAFEVDTEKFCSIKAQLVAVLFSHDPTLENLEMCYSTDNGENWSPVKVNMRANGYLWATSEGKFPIYSFTTEDLVDLTDTTITNLMIKPYGEN